MIFSYSRLLLYIRYKKKTLKSLWILWYDMMLTLITTSTTTSSIPLLSLWSHHIALQRVNVSDCVILFLFLIQKTTTTMTRDSRGIFSRIENWVYWKWGELKLSRRQTKGTNTHMRVSSVEPQGEAIFKLILSIFGGRKVCFFIADNSNAISSFERARETWRERRFWDSEKNSRFRLKVIKSVSPANMINSFS